MATEETGEVTGTKDKDYNIIWFTEQCLNNALRLEQYAQDAERDGDNELAEFFRRAQGESRKGAEQGKDMLRARLRSRLASPGVGGEQRRLRDGSTIEIRRVRADDAERLEAAFGRLSDDSRRRRFLSPKARLSQTELRYLTDVDHHRHEALVAVTPDEREELVGVARFIRLADEPEAAEAAITVADEWQRRGVATALLDLLRTRALAEGIHTFSTEVLPENERRIRALFGQVGELSDRRGAIPVRMRFALDARAEGHDPATGLRAAAAGALRVVTSAVPGPWRRVKL